MYLPNTSLEPSRCTEPDRCDGMLRDTNMKLNRAEESEGLQLTRLHAEGAHVLPQFVNK
jgi:hypothetical protein